MCLRLVGIAKEILPTDEIAIETDVETFATVTFANFADGEDGFFEILANFCDADVADFCVDVQNGTGVVVCAMFGATAT